MVKILYSSEMPCNGLPRFTTIPIIAELLNEDGSDNLSETIEANYKCVKQEILSLVESEIERIKNDAKLKHLIKE